MESTLTDTAGRSPLGNADYDQQRRRQVDAYFSADVETDGPIPGPYSILSFAIVYAGSFNGSNFQRPANYELQLYKELQPISTDFVPEALRVNGLDRGRLCLEGEQPDQAMTEACKWVKMAAGDAQPGLC